MLNGVCMYTLNLHLPISLITKSSYKASHMEADTASSVEVERRFSGAKASSSGSQALTSANAATAGPKRFIRQQVPDDILLNVDLALAIAVLPSNYNFEIQKTVWRLRQAGVRRVALQFPEGLLMYACVIADILEKFAGVEHAFIMGDVTFGACCVDDFSACALGAEFLVHYGHSCLVPVDVTKLPCLYVFVDISIDIDHLVATVQLNFALGARLLVAGTIQFSSAVQLAKQRLAADYPSLAVPKCRPLSPGEVLGCTAPALEAGSADAIVFVADGRFHLEAIMIANPTIPAYRYDPYSRQLIAEQYDQEGMRLVRRRAIEASRSARNWGLVQGTLGRQGNPAVLELLQRKLAEAGFAAPTTLLLSELNPDKLAMVPSVDAWVQVACPRLSIDWGEGFSRPTLTPYEALVALGAAPAWWDDDPVAGGMVTHSNGARTAAARTTAQALSAAPPPGLSTEMAAGTAVAEEAQPAAGPTGHLLLQPLPAVAPYPMDYYAAEGGEWSSSYHRRPARPVKAA